MFDNNNKSNLLLLDNSVSLEYSELIFIIVILRRKNELQT